MQTNNLIRSLIATFQQREFQKALAACNAQSGWKAEEIPDSGDQNNYVAYMTVDDRRDKTSDDDDDHSDRAKSEMSDNQFHVPVGTEIATRNERRSGRDSTDTGRPAKSTWSDMSDDD